MGTHLQVIFLLSTAYQVSDSTEVMRQLTNASDSGHALKNVCQSVGLADASVTGGLRVPSLLDHQPDTQHCHGVVI